MFPLLHPLPITIISIRLSGFDHKGDPSYLVFNGIKPYFTKGALPALYINITYSFPSDDDGVGMEKYVKDIKKAVAKLAG